MFHPLVALTAVLAILFPIAVKGWEQVPLDQGKNDEGLFQPLGDLSLLPAHEFTTLNHPAFPRHSLRVKKTDLCNDGTGAYTGYLDVDTRHIFFYFFESQNDSENDDVILWTRGGSECSGAYGAFFEFGPCKIVASDKMEENPHSWTQKASVFAVDQPIDNGFSYAEPGERRFDIEDAAKDIAALVVLFFEHFTKFQGNPFHLASSSSGGRYIPVFASEIWDSNPKLVNAGITPINIESLIIGNGCIDPVTMIPSYYDMQCTDDTVAPKLDIGTCLRQKQMIPRCRKWLKESCHGNAHDNADCRAAMMYCRSEIEGPFWANMSNNPFDLRKTCESVEGADGYPPEAGLCYPVLNAVRGYLNRVDIRELLGVDAAVSHDVPVCSHPFTASFQLESDMPFPAQDYIAALLQRNVRVLMYGSPGSWICNWVGTERMLKELQWSWKEHFASAVGKIWWDNERLIGSVKSTGPLTYITLLHPGHMVAHDAPEDSLKMLSRWLKGDDGFQDL